MKIYDYINMDELYDMIDRGYIKVTNHPKFPLTMYSYTKSCHYEKMWNDTTMKCRGLIVDANDNIESKPLKKFFNFEEYVGTIPSNKSPKIIEKLDGTLGIMYWYDNIPYIATKGSFDNEQSIHATNILHTKYRDVWSRLNQTHTYLFEIIYREDKHIISYPDIDDIFLIAVIDSKADNIEYDIYDYSYFNTPKIYSNVKDWMNVRDEIDGANKEGFVLLFEDNFRLKMKYNEYLELHMEKYSFSKKKLFQLVMNNDNDSIKRMMSLFEDEDRVYIQSQIDVYRNEYNRIFNICKAEFKTGFKTGKEAAEYIKTCTYPHILFITMVKGGNADALIWKYVKENVY